MERGDDFLKVNTKGITIIELMLGVVLFSIVALSITYFISTGAKTCGEAENTINVQEESQVVMNQLLGITVEGNSLDFKTDPTGDARFYVMNTDKKLETTNIEKILYFKKSSGELYYYEVNSSTSDDDKKQIAKEISGATSSISLGQLLGEYLTEFKVAIDTTSYNVTFEVDFNLLGKEMKSKDSITLRNRYVETKHAFIEIK